MLYCVSHKPLPLPDVPGLQLMQVGGGPDFSPVRDNSGEHIAARNAGYSEATAFYQVWKNRPSEFVGFCHYRRFLLTDSLSTRLAGQLHEPCLPDGTPLENYASGRRVAPGSFFNALQDRPDYVAQLQSQLGDADVLLPRSNPLPPGGFMAQYAGSHPLWPFFNLLSLMSKEDNRLAADAVAFFTRARHAYWNNLMLMRGELFDQYCQFLFHWLFELEQKTSQPQHPYQKRVFAFLSERLLNFWIHREGLSVAECDWCMTEDIGMTDEPHQRRVSASTP
ncbi:DUF4422 domain-containing protein [Granulosicoccaceae sp. 1_MG-2023]|nr:DUF4422 domain-containing protein [Granulosicoccaceae sp. 1_MG-2023]